MRLCVFLMALTIVHVAVGMQEDASIFALDNSVGIWRPQGAPPDVRTCAVYDPLDPTLAQPRMGSASSSNGSRSPRNPIAPRSRPDSRDPGQPDGKNWFQPV